MHSPKSRLHRTTQACGAYRQRHVDHFNLENSALQPQAPNFPDARGHVVYKAAMGKGFVTAFAHAGFPCRDASGRRCFGGQSCRVAGSRFWAAHGLELMKLHIFSGGALRLYQVCGRCSPCEHHIVPCTAGVCVQLLIQASRAFAR